MRKLLLLSAAVVILSSFAHAQEPGLGTERRQTEAQNDQYKELTGLARAEREAATLTKNGLPAVVFEGELRGSFSSRTAKPGDLVSLTLRKPATLPDGIVVAKGTVIQGHVVQAAAHTRDYKNGAILLTFDEARPRGAPEFPMFALISVIAPSASEQTNVTGSVRHGTIGASSNSPNAVLVQRGGLGDAVIAQASVTSGIPRMLVVASPGGSGILMGTDDNAAMYSTQLITLVGGRATPQATTLRAYSVLHPKTANAPAVPAKK